MIDQVPYVIRNNLNEYFLQTTHTEVDFTNFKFTAGGSINQAGQLSTSQGNYFLKWNDRFKYPGMFAAESKGLALIGQTNTVCTPKILLTGETDLHQFLLLEFLYADTKSKTYWTDLGYQLANLHRISNSTFGLDHDNYIGSLPQRNAVCDSWIEFFVTQRLTPLLQHLTETKNISTDFRQSIEKIFSKLDEIFPPEMPSLLHGDLWSGNAIVNGQGGPAVIDPAVYYGHREAELAFTRLFGGFEKGFYESYCHHFPLEHGFEQRKDVYNLYPLLVHAILFGDSYLGQVKRIIKHFT